MTSFVAATFYEWQIKIIGLLNFVVIVVVLVIVVVVVTVKVV